MVDKNLGLFQNHLSLEISDYKISAFDNIDNYLIVGDEKGNLYTYEINESGIAILNHTKLIKYKIDQIKCLNLSNPRIGLVLSNNILYAYTIPLLDKLADLKIDTYKFTINEKEGQLNQILTVSKKKHLKFYEYKPELTKFVDLKFEEMRMADLPEILEWNGRWICHTVKKKYSLTSTTGDVISPGLEITHAKNVNGLWLIVQKEGIGLFMENANPKNQNPLCFTARPTIVNITIYKNYALSLYDNSIGIFDINDSSPIQEVNIENGFIGRYIISNSKRVFYVVNSVNEKNANFSFQIWELKALAFHKQITKLLNELKIDEALNILNNNVLSSDENKPKKIEKFFLDCSWACLKKNEFKKAHLYAKLTNFNIIEFIYLFSDLLKVKVNDEDRKKLVGINILTGLNEESNKDALMMLCNMLQDKRTYLINNNDIPKDMQKKIVFEKSDNTLIDLSKQDFYLQQVLELIHTTLIKAYVVLKLNIKRISEIIEYDYFTFDYEDLKHFLEKEYSNLNESKVTLAYIYEKKSKYEDALKIWAEFGNKNESNIAFSREACEKTKVILRKCNDKKLFVEYIAWMIIKYTDSAFDLYLSLNNIIPIEGFLSIINNLEKSVSNVKEKFLEYLFLNGGNSERFHTMLAEIYIEKLFKIVKKDSEYDLQSIKDVNFKPILEKLEKLIKNSVYYNPQHILDIIKNSWMVHLEIYLYSKLSMHKEALEKLSHIGVEEKSFEKAEDYCEKAKKDELFEQLFTIISRNYTNNLKNIKMSTKKEEKASYETSNNLYKKQMLNILKRYGENTQLDPFFILEQIPGDWLISDSSLYNYITKIMKTYTHIANRFKIERNLSEMDQLYKESELFMAKNKCVSIGIETICEGCNRKINQKMISVYPNMKVYHQNCVQNPNVCPSTRVDFSKTNFL